MQCRSSRDRRFWSAALLLVLCLSSSASSVCLRAVHAQDGRTPIPSGAPIPARAAVPPEDRFDAKRAFALLERQVAFGPRCNACPGHKQAQEFFESYLKALGAEVRLQSFSRELPHWEGTKKFTNIIARFQPRKEPRVLLGTHYDTRARADSPLESPANWATPIDGANDGASGVAVLLELAQVIAEDPPSVGVDIILFDGEDFGRPDEIDTNYFIGSRYFAGRMPQEMPGYKPRFAVVLDMVGDRELRIPPRRLASQSAPGWPVQYQSQKLDDALHLIAKHLGVPQFGGEPGSDILDDHHALQAVGIPAVVLIDYPKDTWHTLRDTVENCRPMSLRGVGVVLLHMLYHPETHPDFTDKNLK